MSVFTLHYNTFRAFRCFQIHVDVNMHFKFSLFLEAKVNSFQQLQHFQIGFQQVTIRFKTENHFQLAT